MGLGPHRVYRGRVLAALRGLPRHGGTTLPLRARGPLVHKGYADGDAPWLTGVVASLAKHGQAVAEERPGSGLGGSAKVVGRLP